MWPPSSPDLNPMDFSLWSILEQRACAKSHKSVVALKISLKKAWAKIPKEVIQAACNQVQGRLKAVVKVKGGHIEKV